MSTYDVPGANPANGDELRIGCWAEHDDGSLLYVEGTEASRVIYCLFDLSKSPPIQFRDAMPKVSFEKTYSWTAKKPKDEKWTWHDKTPFPWDRVIKSGVHDGPGHASAADTMTAAARIAQRLKLEAEAWDAKRTDGQRDEVRNAGIGVWNAIDNAVRKFLQP